MKAVIQRVKNADVAVNGETVGKCGNGLMVLFGAETGDTAEDAVLLAKKQQPCEYSVMKTVK